MGFPKTQIMMQRISEHGVILLIFVLLVLGIVIWKLSGMNEGYLDAGLAEIRAQIIASDFKNQTPGQLNSCPMSKSKNSTTGQPPCFLGIKDNQTTPKPELPRPRHNQFSKCIRCEDIINRPVSIAPANGNFGLGHFLGKKKDNNSVIIIPESMANSSVRRATDGNFRLILGLADPLNGVTIYHPETDSVIARDASGKVKLAPIDDFAGALAPAATFLLMDGLANYSAVSFKCMQINDEPTDRYLGFEMGAVPGGTPLQVLTAHQQTNKGVITDTFDILDVETGMPVIMNKHSGKPCMSREGFWDGDGNIDLRDKREVGAFVLAGEIDSSELTKKEVIGGLTTDIKILGYSPEPQNGIHPVSLDSLIQPGENNSQFKYPPYPLGGIPDHPFLTTNNANHANNNTHNVEKFDPIQSTATVITPTNGQVLTMEDVSKPPSNLFTPGYGLAFNNVLNEANAKYKDQISDNVFNKLNVAKLNPSVQNILDYNSATYKIYNQENQAFDNKISIQDKSNTKRLDDLIGTLDNQRVQAMSRDLFFFENQRAKNQAKPVFK